MSDMKLIIERELLERLALHDGISDAEYRTCEWCGNDPVAEHQYYDGATQRIRSAHTPDCPWVLARAVLGDNLD